MASTRIASLALAAAAITAAAAACSGAAPKPSAPSSSTSSAPASPASSTTAGAADLPSTPVGVQARWLLAAVAHLPIPVAQVTAHFDQAFRTAVSPAELNAVLADTKSIRVDSITSQVKSLPSGELQNEPDGTKVTVRQAAADMISQSDNTAADLLITLLGRGAVEAAAVSTGMADPGRDVPFLTTRELFVLKLDDWPRLAQRYLALDTAGRTSLLATTIDRVPLSTLSATPWTEPRDIGSLEWFATPADICHVYASLAALAAQPALAPVASVLQINDGGLGLDASQWTSVWFKGGSEPGVLTLNYLATTRTGQKYLVSVLTANPVTAFPQTPAALTLLGAIKGAFQLAAA